MMELDDSGLTAVSVCECGASFLGYGDLRLGIARLEWARHDHRAAVGEFHNRSDAQRATLGHGTPPTAELGPHRTVKALGKPRPTTPTTATEPKPLKRSNFPKSAARAGTAEHAASLIRAGQTLTGAAKALSVARSTLGNWMREHGHGDLLARPGWNRTAWDKSVATRQRKAAS